MSGPVADATLKELADCGRAGRAELEARIARLVDAIETVEREVAGRVRSAAQTSLTHPDAAARAEASVRQQAYQTVLETIRAATDSLTTVDKE